MILDAHNLFSSAQALTASAGTYISDNVIDRGANSNLGSGCDLHIDIALTAKSGTTPTIYAEIHAADNAALSTNPIIIARSQLLTDPAVPSTIRMSIPSMSAALAGKRYWGLKYTTTGTTPSFTITSGIVLDEQTNMQA